MQNLSVRLSAIASLIPEGAKVCDVGTDHAFLPIALKKSGRAVNVIATDINEKPLKKARENIEKANVSDISLRLCDGIEGVGQDEADCFIVAGIGGEVISGILSRGIDNLSSKDITLILQPTTSPEFLRKFLYDNGFVITEEIPIEENSKLYSVMKCCYSGEKQIKEKFFYFSGLVNPLDPSGKKYIEKQTRRAFKCVKALENIPEKSAEYKYYKEIYDSLWHLTQDF